jgi:hypothetical protein
MTRSWSDEQISAFLDGELEAADMDALAKDMETSAELAARVERLGAATQMFVAASGEIDRHPMSAGLQGFLARADEASNVVPFRRKGVTAFIMEHRAIAACLVCAVAALAALPQLGADNDNMLPDAGGIIAQTSPLHRMLEDGGSGRVVSIADGVTATPRLTFASADGGYCRQFEIDSASGEISAVACRDKAGWHAEMAVYGAPDGAGYTTASGDTDRTLDAFIDKLISGDPLDADAEKALIARDWGERGA